jgi:hypothetical protein
VAITTPRHPRKTCATNISRATPPATDVLTGAKAITAGGGSFRDHACALLNDGTFSCWGGDVTGLNSYIAMPVAVEPFCR